ncbi:type II toxin-antitoxin system RelE family toxin [Zhihengliuella halotolerans]|uniref:mRNA interferase RelE/StbE n=1 Tax=Zhihengliuella halotolerans TaxID=370736 RepID=A0A4Q8AHD4_9MICC|nr:type II toxin-antitoxin system RelE/ParE family toxin [Zhihengliuella halotolerans]RZU63099.1 mRNA interferase RelE/StbE [Zhihengliuella halotolerans]
MSYRIEYTAAASRLIQKVPPPERKRVLDLTASLADNPRPHGCKKLTGREAWRVRSGNYRVIYEIDDGRLLVTVVRAGHRRDIYDQ